jgi:hypothetical protein
MYPERCVLRVTCSKEIILDYELKVWHYTLCVALYIMCGIIHYVWLYTLCVALYIMCGFILLPFSGFAPRVYS